MRMAAQTPVIEAGRVFIPHDAAWLDGYLHELAMFPKGRFDDQADSTSQALCFIGAPNGGEQWLDTMHTVELARYGLNPEDLTTTFDHIDHDTTFHLSNGRIVMRHYDGFYHVTAQEWQEVRALQGVTRMESMS